MNIVVLDGFTANPGDLDWKKLEALGRLTVYERTPQDKILLRCADAEIIYTNKTELSGDILSRMKSLKFVGVLATGYNVVDIDAARKLGITVCNVPSYSTMSVAQNVFSLILEITNSVGHYTEEVRNGKWSTCKDFSFTDTAIIELAGKQIGIIGYGEIGRRVAAIAQAFGMKVGAFSSKSQEDIFPVKKMQLDELFSTSDILSLHCPLTPQTHHIVNKETLRLMKKSAILINTGRGPLVEESALAEALNTGIIAAAGLDVLADEPPREDNPLLSAPNCFITPHISWATKEARSRLIEVSVSNLEAFLAGKPQNVVS